MKQLIIIGLLVLCVNTYAQHPFIENIIERDSVNELHSVYDLMHNANYSFLFTSEKSTEPWVMSDNVRDVSDTISTTFNEFISTSKYTVLAIDSLKGNWKYKITCMCDYISDPVNIYISRGGGVIAVLFPPRPSHQSMLVSIDSELMIKK